MKKLFLVFLAVVVTGGLVFAGGTQEPAAKDQQPVRFDFWTTQTQSDRMATIQVLIDTYTAMNPNVTINLVGVDENDMVTNVQTAVAAGTLPGMFESNAETVVSFGSEGILDVQAATALADRIGTDRFYQGALRVMETSDGDGYYALPYHGWVQGIWYRADWFEEAGLNPPSTWEDILAAAEYFYQPDQNQYGILVGTTAENYTEQCFTPIAMSNNAGLFDADGNLIFNSPQMKEAVEYYAQLAQYNPPGPQTWRARDYYLQGKLAMFFYSTYIMDDLAVQEAAADSLTGGNFAELEGAGFDPDLVKNTRVATTVSHKADAGYGSIIGLGMFEQSNPAVTEAVSDFIAYLYTQNAYITFLHMAPGGMNPMLREIATNARFQNDPSGLFKYYGPEKMAEIISGLENIQPFSIVEGNRIEAASVHYRPANYSPYALRNYPGRGAYRCGNGCCGSGNEEK